MAKKINIIGAKPRRIQIVNQPRRRLEPAEIGKGLGAAPCGERITGNVDLIGLAELGTQLLARLRSSGGRPALSDATEICRVPLSAADIKALEGVVVQIEQSSGAKPSVGQMVSVIIRTHLEALQALTGRVSAAAGDVPITKVEQPIPIAILQKMLDEQITPLREQVHRLESELHAVAAGSK
jgi:hypothetical protein